MYILFFFAGLLVMMWESSFCWLLHNSTVLRLITSHGIMEWILFILVYHFFKITFLWISKSRFSGISVLASAWFLHCKTWISCESCSIVLCICNISLCCLFPARPHLPRLTMGNNQNFGFNNQTLTLIPIWCMVMYQNWKKGSKSQNLAW